MGGNALKNTPTRRYKRDEFFEIQDLVVKTLKSTLKTDVATIPAYRTKPDFGDLDVLVKTPIAVNASEDFFKAVFDSKEVVKNGGVTSFEFREFQVDAIMTHQDYFDYARNYFSWNDCGNLVGRLTHSIGLKHGHNGLLLPVRDEDHMLTELTITTDHDKTLEYAGLDVDRFKEGFDTLEEMFQWVTTSKYFNPDIYLFQNRNHAARTRDAKRPTYNKFLKWVEDTKPKTNFVANREKRETEYLDLIWANFPHREKDYLAILLDLHHAQRRRNKFNGGMVMEWTGLTGKRLGEFLKMVNAVIKADVIDEMSIEDIKDIVMAGYGEWIKNEKEKNQKENS